MKGEILRSNTVGMDTVLGALNIGQEVFLGANFFFLGVLCGIE